MFGYFVSSQSFGNIADIDFRTMLFEQRMKEIEDDLPPFGIIDDGSSYSTEVDLTDPYNAGWHDISVDQFTPEEW